MHKRSIIPVFIFLLISLLFSSSSAYDLTLNNTPTQVYFSPNGGATKAIVKEIDNATLEVLVQAYSFTSKSIARALVNAKKRAVSVEAILDKPSVPIYMRHFPPNSLDYKGGKEKWNGKERFNSSRKQQNEYQGSSRS